MGLFSSKTKVTVGTQVSRVIGDTLLPNAVKTGVSKAILGGGFDSTAADYVMEEAVSSIGVRAERMFRYGSSGYVFGLPSGKYTSQSKGRSQAQAILDAQYVDPVLVDYCNFGPPNFQHIGWARLVQDYGWNSVTNELATLSAQEGVPVYLGNLEVIIPTSSVSSYEDGVLDQWGPPATAGAAPGRLTPVPAAGALRAQSPILTDANAVDAYIRVTAIWQEVVPTPDPEYPMVITNVTTTYTTTHTIPLTGFESNGDYFHVRYTVLGQAYFWMYLSGSGTYPTLDELFDDPFETNGSYFPFLYLRFNQQNGAANPASQEYQSSERLAKYLGIDYAQVCDAVDQNPDIADVQQAVIMFAVPANSSNPLEQRYLFDYFNTLYQNQETKFQSAAHAENYLRSVKEPNINRHAVIIQDSRFKIALMHSGMFKKAVAGSIGPVGTYSIATGSFTEEVTYTDQETMYTTTYYWPIQQHFYRKQITAGLYEEIAINQLTMRYYVLDGYFTTADETDDILMIPLDRSITHEYSVIDREQLYSRALHYVFNSAIFTKVKWYQTGIFQAIIIVVALVIAFKTGQFELISAALAGNAAAAIALLQNLLIGLLVQQGIKLFVKAVGGELAMILAVVAAVVATIQGYRFGSIKGAPWAKELLYAANGLSKAVTEFYAEGIQKLIADYASTRQYQKELMEGLDEAKKLLENDNIMSPFVIFGEKPDDYFNRTVHSGNVGIVGIQAISNYVDNALKLPQLPDTITA